MVTVINQRQADVDAEFDQNPVELGENASASGDGATALGVDAGAFADGSIAIGENSEINVEDVASIGDRDLFLTDGHSIVYPADQGSQTLADLPIEDAPEGEEHSILLTVAGETALEVFAEADGSGGVQNLSVNLPDDLDVSGGVEADDILSEAIEITDADGNSYFAVDANGATTALQLAGNDIEGLNKIIPTDDELLVEGDLTISGELTENASF